MLCGASAGAIVAALVCTRTDDELTETFAHVSEFDLNFFLWKSTGQYVRHFLSKGYAQDEMHIKRRLRALVSKGRAAGQRERGGDVVRRV